MCMCQNAIKPCKCFALTPSPQVQHSAACTSTDGSQCVQIQAEARIRLVSGIKRYFHGKWAEGLLSARGMQLLDFACDVQMDHADRSLFMWTLAERYETLRI